jgi:glycogen debranching enzyme
MQNTKSHYFRLHDFVLSTATMLDKKRYVAAGQKAYVVGTTDGKFPDLGWHKKGKMGGIWTPPIRIVESYNISINSIHLEVDEFLSGLGYAQFNYKELEDLYLSRVEFALDEFEAAIVGIRLFNNTTQSQKILLSVATVVDLDWVYPWDSTVKSQRNLVNVHPIIDSDNGILCFQNIDDACYMGISASLFPDKMFVEQELGTFEWSLEIPSQAENILWMVFAGSRISQDQLTATIKRLCQSPFQLLSEKIATREAKREFSKIHLPDDEVMKAFEWGKLNLMDQSLKIDHVNIRDVNVGRDFPPPIDSLPQISGIVAGYPDYAWFFGTDGCYTIYALMVTGQWETAIEHLRTIRNVSRLINGLTGKVIHELLTDGSVFYGSNQHKGNLNETLQFIIATDIVWQWTGFHFLVDEFYDFMKEGIFSLLKNSGEADYPRGSGIIERESMGEIAVDVIAYLLKGLETFVKMANYRGDLDAAKKVASYVLSLQDRFDKDWWMPDHQLYADSLDYVNGHYKQIQNHHWINAVPMETGIASPAKAIAALQRLESESYTGDYGLYHTGLDDKTPASSELKVWTLPTAVMAVAEAKYGRFDQSLTYVQRIAGLLDLEMPGALPEIAPSPQYDVFGPLDERAMFMQAWSCYGIHWTVVHYFLGIKPEMAHNQIYILPGLPNSWSEISIENLRVGSNLLTMKVIHQDKAFNISGNLQSESHLVIGCKLSNMVAITSVSNGIKILEFNIENKHDVQEIQADIGMQINFQVVIKYRDLE